MSSVKGLVCGSGGPKNEKNTGPFVSPEERSRDGITPLHISVSALFFISLLGKIYCITIDEPLKNALDLIEWVMYGIVFVEGLLGPLPSKRCLAGIGAVFLCFAMTYLVSGYAELLKALILALALRNVDRKSVFTALLIALIASIALTVTLYLSGVSDAGVQRRGAISLGYNQANTVGFVLMAVTLLVFARSDRVSFVSRVLLLFMNIVGFLLSGGRTGFLVAVCAILCLGRTASDLLEKSKAMRLLACWMPFVCCGFVIITALLYPVSSLSQQIDGMLTSRVWLNYYNLTTHEIPFFGQSIDLWSDDLLIQNPVTGLWSTYMTVDCAYVMLLLQMGLLSTFAIFLIYRNFVRRLIEAKEYTLVVILALLSLYAIMESFALSIFVFFPLLTYFAKKETGVELQRGKYLATNRNCSIEFGRSYDT